MWLTGVNLEHIFTLLDDEEYFKKFICDFYEKAPDDLGTLIDCGFEVDDSRLSLAYSKYRVNLDSFAVLLQSQDPDHYKNFKLIHYHIICYREGFLQGPLLFIC